MINEKQLSKLILETIRETIANDTNLTLLEGRKKGVLVTVNGKEVPFGHDSHVKDLEATLEGLNRIKNCYTAGSSHRQTYSQACTRIKNLLKDMKRPRMITTAPISTSLDQKE